MVAAASCHTDIPFRLVPSSGVDIAPLAIRQDSRPPWINFWCGRVVDRPPSFGAYQKLLVIVARTNHLTNDRKQMAVPVPLACCPSCHHVFDMNQYFPWLLTCCGCSVCYTCMQPGRCANQCGRSGAAFRNQAMAQLITGGHIWVPVLGVAAAVVAGAGAGAAPLPVPIVPPVLPLVIPAPIAPPLAIPRVCIATIVIWTLDDLCLCLFTVAFLLFCFVCFDVRCVLIATICVCCNRN
jgi:hypothetical protein